VSKAHRIGKRGKARRSPRAFLSAILVVASAVALIQFPSTPALAAFTDFVDLENHWAKTAVQELYSLGALDEQPPVYSPDAPITRGKVSRYLAIGWGIEPYSGYRSFFDDVPDSDAYFRYANAMYLRGIMVGSGDLFGVDDPLSREQAATVLVRAAGFEPAALALSQAQARAIVSHYKDSGQISGWALPYVAQAYVAGLFQGDAAGTFRPLAGMSKAEACTVVARVRDARELLDFGDAPDLPPYFNFPSLLASDGARHHDYRTVWLGETADGEIDSRQVNADFFDDGFMRFVPGGTAQAPTYQIEFVVSVAGRDPSLYGNTDDKALFFNLLIDWDRDMVWEEGEWAVQNLKIDPGAWAPGATSATLVSPSFTPGASVLPYDCWFRMTLTKGEPLPAGWVGKGEYAYGETEDYGPEEHTVLIASALDALCTEWQASTDPNRNLVASCLDGTRSLVADLIAEEKRDDPVDVFVDKKMVILDLFYANAELAVDQGLAQADVDRVMNGLWLPMAFVAEQGMERQQIILLGETLRLNFGIPAYIGQGIQNTINQLADLLFEQERGDPARTLLDMKDEIIRNLQELSRALGVASPPDRDQAEAVFWVLVFMSRIKDLEQPAPPAQPPEPLRKPRDKTEPPGTGKGPGQAPPGKDLVLTGVESVFEATSSGRITLKVHVLKPGFDFYDLEIYYTDQIDWSPSTTVTPVSGPFGWQAGISSTGVRFYGDRPIEPCTPAYFIVNIDPPQDFQSIRVVLTDKAGMPIGRVVSQRVPCGFMVLAPFEKGSFGEAAGYHPGDPEGWDLAYVVGEGCGRGSACGEGAHQLVANSSTGGGIASLRGGPSDLEPGGYAPSEGSAYAPICTDLYPGQYLVVRDHTGIGHALLLVMRADCMGCVLKYEHNPAGRLFFEEP
jgi:hypothetical protein